MTEAVEPSVTESPRPIVARAGRYYRNARYIMVFVGVAMGAWFLYDGFIAWPQRNEQITKAQTEYDVTPKGSPRWYELEAQLRKLGALKTGLDINLQKVFGFGVPTIALAYLYYVIKKSRGEIRLENDVLTVPGHPAVPVAAVKSIDARLWKKKGIAIVKYDVDGQPGEFTLDDFVYEQSPIDKIYDRLVAANTPPAETTPTQDATPADELTSVDP